MLQSVLMAMHSYAGGRYIQRKNIRMEPELPVRNTDVSAGTERCGKGKTRGQLLPIKSNQSILMTVLKNVVETV